MVKLKDLWKYLGTGTLAAMAVDGYRRTLINDGVINTETKIQLEKAKELAKAANEKYLNTAEGKVEFETKVKARIASLEENYNERKDVENKLKTATGEAKDKLEEKSKELDNKIKDSIKDISNSDLSDIFTKFIEKYYQFLNGLSLDQIVAFFNLIIDFSLGFSLYTLASLFMGEHIIDYFKLEIKFPKLASLIRLRININKHLKMFNLGIFILFLLAGIVGNIYMFLLKYFV
jgi:hypothetical protein